MADDPNLPHMAASASASVERLAAACASEGTRPIGLVLAESTTGSEPLPPATERRRTHDVTVKKFATVALLLLLGVAGTFNGLSLTTDPTGRSLGLTVEMLPAWHTWDYRVSGLFVLMFLGLGPLICVAAVLVDASEAAVFVAFVGLVTIGWAVWQILVLDIYAPLAQIPLTLLGGALIILAVGEFLTRARDRSRR